MSDQNQFDPYKQKLLHYWALFLAGCGTLWEHIKKYSRTAAEVISRYAKLLVRKLKTYAQTALQWLRKVWDRIRPWCSRLVQTLAAWLLLAREKAGPIIEKAKVWIGIAAEKAKVWIGIAAGKAKVWIDSVKARLPQREAALPAPEDDIVDAEEETEPEQAPAAKAPRNLPAWMSTPWVVKTMAVFAAIGVGIKFVFRWLCKLYKLFLAAPVVWYAIKFARENMARLPEEVGLDIQSTGEFARMISRQQAVYWPLGITMFCLVLMFISKKPILPWVISIFTLVLPWLIWILNYYA